MIADRDDGDNTGLGGSMKAVFGDEKNFKQCYGTPIPGNFALEVDPPKDVKWHHCREQFAAEYCEGIAGFFFSHASRKGEDVANFLVKFESILSLPDLKTPYPYSTFSKTNKQTILWVEASRFWRLCQMRRSLLTVILRCGLNYDTAADNFDEALFAEKFIKQNEYARDTRPALLRFMFGFTKFTGVFPAVGSYTSVLKHGWAEEFKKKDESTIRRLLVLPDGEPRESSVVGIESLWT